MEAEATRVQPELIPPNHVARPWKRIAGRGLDMFLIWIVSVLLSYVLLLATNMTQLEAYDDVSIDTLQSLVINCSSIYDTGCQLLIDQTVIMLYVSLIYASISLLYYVILTKQLPHATLGKYILGIRVQSLYETISWTQAILRHLPWLILDIIIIAILLVTLQTGYYFSQTNLLSYLFYMLIIGQILLTEWRQGLHDTIAHTAVVDAKNDTFTP